MAFKSMKPKKLWSSKSHEAADELAEQSPKPSIFERYVAQDKNGFKAYTKKHRRPYGEEQHET